MKWRNGLFMLMVVIILWGNGNFAARGEGDAPPAPVSKAVHDIQLVYASPEINEAPFFISGSIVFESGDNRNDSLAWISMDGYDDACTRYNNPALFSELENPRPDVPDGKTLVFSAIGKNGKKGIYQMDNFEAYGVGKATAATVWANQANNWHPALNSKQKLLAYVSDSAGAPQIFLLDLASQKNRQLTYLAKAASPFIDAAGEWIYFSGADQSGNEDIYKIKTNGTELTRLTDGPEIEKYPTLTKYGKWIVYEKGTQTTRGIWIMSLDGKIQKQVSDPAQWLSAPCMNYSGTKVVFEGVLNHKRGIYMGEVSDEVFSGATAREFTPGINVAQEVVNLSQFGAFTPGELQKLSTNGFLVAPTAQKQLFYTYEENEYKNIPSFVTADNLLQLLHITCDTSLRKAEEQSLLPKLSQFTLNLLMELEKRGAAQTRLGNDPAYVVLRRYFEVLYNLVNNKPYAKLNPHDLPIVAAELARIKAEQFAAGALFPKRKFDYSLFKVRGHYDTSVNLRRYFKAMSWLGNMTLATDSMAERQLAFLAADLLRANPEALAKFRDIYRITAFYSGPADDPNLDDFAAFWEKETGGRPAYTAYNDIKMQQVLERLFKTAGARIATHFRQADLNQNKVLSFMGSRYVADSHLFSLLFERLGQKYRPGGLDLFAALDNNTAYRLLTDDGKIPEKFPKFTETITEGKQIFRGAANSDPSLFNQWLQLLKTYANSQEKGAPEALRTPGWSRKKLNTALASWAELKHDTVLYGKQTGAECGGGDEPPKVYGYIEPELGFYKDLRATLVTMDRQLREMGSIGVHNLNQLLELIDFFILVSDKELRRVPLGTQENEQIRIIGGLLEAGTVTALDAPMRWWEITSESARNMAVAADIYRYGQQFLTAGVGYGDDLYIIIPVNDQLYLMRGSIFSYYEFFSEKRLSDPEWYEKLKTWDPGKRAEWWRNYLDAQKEAVPAPANPYNSGC